MPEQKRRNRGVSPIASSTSTTTSIPAAPPMGKPIKNKRQTTTTTSVSSVDTKAILRSATTGNLRMPDWKSLGHVFAAGGAHNSVFFVKVSSGLLVVKSAKNTPFIVAATELLYRGGCTTPGARLVVKDCDEWKEIATAICANNEQAWRFLQSGSVVVMEFVRGQPFDSFDLTQAFPTAASRSNMGRQLGRVLGVDLLLNNHDRFPVLPVWKHAEFNLGNFMLAEDGETIVSIDHNLCAIKFAFAESHAKNVKQLLDAIVKQPHSVCGFVNAFCQQFKQQTGYEMDQDSALAFQEGVLDSVCTLGVLSKSGMLCKLVAGSVG